MSAYQETQPKFRYLEIGEDDPYDKVHTTDGKFGHGTIQGTHGPLVYKIDYKRGIRHFEVPHRIVILGIACTGKFKIIGPVPGYESLRSEALSRCKICSTEALTDRIVVEF